jgi:hypothetical protein
MKRQINNKLVEIMETSEILKIKTLEKTKEVRRKLEKDKRSKSL